jgi:hypothetical protein
MALSTGDAGTEHALRSATAKGLAIGAIAGTFAAAAMLIAWPEPTKEPDTARLDADRPAPLITPRAVPIGLVEVPRTRRAAIRSSKTAPAQTAIHVAARVTMPPEAVPLPTVPAAPEPGARNEAAPAIDEEALLTSRSIAFGSEAMPVSSVSVPVELAESPRRSGALTRAMGTTADAFRTAGTSVVGAFRKVF